MNRTHNCVLIDDDPDEHEIFRMSLSVTSMKVSCSYFHSFTDAYKLFTTTEGEPPHFIFLDFYYKGEIDRKNIKELRKLDRLEKTQIVVYSGFLTPRTDFLAQELGCKFLAKPFSVNVPTTELKALLLAR